MPHDGLKNPNVNSLSVDGWLLELPVLVEELPVLFELLPGLLDEVPISVLLDVPALLEESLVVWVSLEVVESPFIEEDVFVAELDEHATRVIAANKTKTFFIFIINYLVINLYIIM